MQPRRIDGLDADALAAVLDDLEADPGVRSVLVLAATSTLAGAAGLDAVVRGRPWPLLGGVFPQVFVDGATLSEGIAVVGLPVGLRTAVIEGLSETTEVGAALEATVEPGGCDGATIITILDGLAERIEPFLTAVFDHVGPFASYLGGGAGTLELASGPCVLTGEGLLADAAVVGILDAPSDVGIAHGWVPVGPPMQVTAGQGRRVAELDHRPAAEVYLDVIEAHLGAPVDLERFGELAPSYPLGITGLDGEVVVRDPIALEDQALICIADVPQRAFVRMLHGDEAALLAAAERSAEGARGPGAPGVGTGGDLTVLFDCISRVLHLGERFAEELAIADLGLPRIGAATIGEVCNPGDRFLEFYNKTIVTGRLRTGEGAGR